MASRASRAAASRPGGDHHRRRRGGLSGRQASGWEFFATSPLPRPLRAIIGEPTSHGPPVRGHKGYCLAEIEDHPASEGHSAIRRLGASAILAAGRMLRELEELGETLKQDHDSRFNPPYTTLNVGLLQGGSAKNVIAGACRMTLEWRPLPGQDVKLVLTEVEKSCARLSTGRIRAAVKPSRLDAGVAAPVGALIAFLEEKTGTPRRPSPSAPSCPSSPCWAPRLACLVRAISAWPTGPASSRRSRSSTRRRRSSPRRWRASARDGSPYFLSISSIL